jgi:hypothetical protein
MLSLQQAIGAEDRQRVVDLASYPFHVNRKNGVQMISDRPSLLRDYSVVFTAGVTQAILAAEARAIVCHPWGFTIGHGIAWGVGSENVPYGISAVTP